MAYSRYNFGHISAAIYAIRFGSFVIHFWCICGRYVAHLCHIFETFLVHFCHIIRIFMVHSGYIFEYSSYGSPTETTALDR